jgi:hypothetical protein
MIYESFDSFLLNATNTKATNATKNVASINISENEIRETKPMLFVAAFTTELVTTEELNATELDAAELICSCSEKFSWEKTCVENAILIKNNKLLILKLFIKRLLLKFIKTFNSR